MPTQEMVAPPRPQPAPRPASAPRRPLAGTLLPALASGGLLWLSFFPVDWGWLGWVALVPLLTLVRNPARSRTVYLAAWAGGLVFFWPALQWMRVADYRMYFTWAGLATACSLFVPLAIYLIRFLDRRTRVPFVLAVPVVWTALEFLRSYLFTGFPWYLLAHTQHDHLPLIQFADVTGAWGVTFLVAYVNALACAALLGWLGRPVMTRRGLLLGAVVLAVALAGVTSYGAYQLGYAAEPKLRVALVQGNLPQYLRNNPTTVESVRDHYEALSDVAAKTRPDLIVWPETSMPNWWQEAWPSGPLHETRELCTKLARRFRTPVLLGLNSAVLAPDRVIRRFNSALLLSAIGDAVARYDKIHRVPFGEYVPLRDVFPFLNWFAPYDFDYSISPGSGATRFPLRGFDPERKSPTFGVVICYEDTDPDMARPYAGADGRPPADFLVNISNDGWFEGTSEHEEHLAICRFRALECRRAVVRSVNMGISALIDGSGRVLAPRKVAEEYVPSGVDDSKVPAAVWAVGPDSATLPSGRWGEFKSVPVVLVAAVPFDGRPSLYARLGDWLPWSCWLLLGACAVASVRRRRAVTPDGSGRDA